MFDLGLACCAVEYAAALDRIEEFAEAGIDPFTAVPEDATVLLVSGTVTDVMAPALADLYARIPEPRYVVSFGACTNSGGPYWDSYSVVKGIQTVVPVDLFIPGCPPRPEALIDGLAQLAAGAAR